MKIVISALVQTLSFHHSPDEFHSIIFFYDAAAQIVPRPSHCWGF